MLPILRYAKVFLRLGGRPKVDLREGSTITFRVWPNDLDLNLHMTNSRYFALMDAARYDMVIRAGSWPVWKRNGWYPVVASQSIRFRRSLRPWSRYTIRTRILGWDERSMYMGQRFEEDGHVCAEAVVRAAFLSKGGRVAPADIMAAAGFPPDSPPLPPDVVAWASATPG